MNSYSSKYAFDEMIIQIENDSPLQNVYLKNTSAIKNLSLYETLDEEQEDFTYSAKSLQDAKMDSIRKYLGFRKNQISKYSMVYMSAKACFKQLFKIKKMGCVNTKTSLKSQSQTLQSAKTQIQIQYQSQDESPYVIKKNPIFQRRASQKSIASPLQTISYVNRNK